jgi:hypothetical protein
MVTQTDVARRTGLDVSSVNKILNRRNISRFGKRTIGLVFETAEALGYDLKRLKHHHRRRDERVAISSQARLSVFLVRSGRLIDKGTCSVRDLSMIGASIFAIALSKGSLPLEPVVLSIRPKIPLLQGHELRGRLVRFFFDDGEASVGMEFIAVTRQTRLKLGRVLSREETR